MKIEKQFLFVVAAFVFSRLAFRTMGGTFDDSCLGWFFQFLDVELLRTDLIRSLWYLHSQPPLFNLFLGCTLQITPVGTWWTWLVGYLFLGLMQCGLLYDCMRRLGAGPGLSAGLVIAYMIGPANLLFENWLFYPYPVATLLLLTVWLLLRYARTVDPWIGFSFFASCAAVSLTRSSFHLVWLAAVVILIVYFRPASRRSICLLATIPFLAVFGWSLKNACLFDSFASSSWMGMNLARATVFRLPDDIRLRWIEEGVLSEVSAIPPFSPVEEYREATSFSSPHPDVPCLEAPLRSTGSPNFNHFVYVEVSKLYWKDAMATVRRDPLGCLGNLGRALLLYFHPPQEFALLSGNRGAIRGWEGFYDRWLGGRLAAVPIERTLAGRAPFLDSFLSCSLVWLTLHPLALLYGIRESVRGCGGRRRLRMRSLVFAFLSFQLLYIGFVGTVFEYGENNRFRFPADGVVLLVAAAFLGDLRRNFARRKLQRTRTSIE